MKTQRWVQEELERAKESFEFRLETLMIELGESISLLMKQRQVTRTELARRLGVSKAYITKVLNGKPNLTLESLLKLSDALEGELKLDVVPRFEAKVRTVQPPKPIVAAKFETVEPIVGGDANDFAIAA